MKPRDLARLIDHTLLKPEASAADVRRLCEEAAEHGFFSVCVNSAFVSLAVGALADTPVAVCAVAGFPLGAMATQAKAYEAALAIDQGAREIDMVLTIGALKAGEHAAVRDDIATVKRACGPALVKVILETGLLSDEEKILACRLAQEAGADFVKTSTGFGHGGATTRDIALMRETVGPAMGVKASGGVRDYATALAMVEAGANRIGASASIAIVTAPG